MINHNQIITNRLLLPFKDNKILIDVTCHLATNEDEAAAALRTKVTNSIASVCEGERRKLKSLPKV